MSALAEIIPFPTFETPYQEINAIIDEARHNQNIIDLLGPRVDNLPEAMVLLNSDIVNLFPQVRDLPARPEDAEWQKFKAKNVSDDQGGILAANTLYITNYIIKAIRPDLFL